MFCKDRAVSHLKSFGYNVVRLPKADISPLQIFTRRESILEPLGELTTILKPINGAEIPTIKRNTPAASISGQKTNDLSLGIGLNILGNIIGAMGGSNSGLEGHYKNARTINFSFEEVLEDAVEVARLDQYLESSDIDPLSRYVGQILEADELYLITSVIKTNKVTVEAKTSSGIQVNVDVPVIKETVGGSVAVSSDNQGQQSVLYAGTVPLVFGFKAIQLFYENGKYQRFAPQNEGTIVLSNETDGSSLFTAGSSLISFK